MIPPTVWTKERLSADAARSLAVWQAEQFAETAQWTSTFDSHRKEFIRLLHELGPGDPAKLWPAQVAEIFAKQLGAAFGYLAGPPLSGDDLRALAGVSLAPGRLAKNPEAARRVLETIRQRLDDRRFPWIADRRPPTSVEQHTAVIASAALMTAQTFAPGHHGSKDAAHEKAVADFLVGLGYRRAECRDINYLEQGPVTGQFCVRCKIDTQRAELALRLFDGRLMAIACEISNNVANGNKRLRKAATTKAQSWQKRIGAEQIVTAVVLSGIFEVESLIQAQSTPLTIFWSHDLTPLRDFVAATKS